MDELRAFLEKNTTAFLIAFAISAVANLLQIYGFWSERKQRRQEELRQKQEEDRLKVYEFLFEAAQKNIKTEQELTTLQEEIASRANTIPELEKRIELLRLAAKREIAEQNIERTIAELRAGMERYAKLHQESQTLGPLPALPESERKRIALEIEAGTRTPYQLPISLTYKVVLLVIIVILLPSPADTVMIAVLFGAFMSAFFEVAAHSPDERLNALVTTHWRSLGFVSAFGIWFSLLNSAELYLGRPVDLLSSALRASFLDYDMGRPARLIEFVFNNSYIWQNVLFVVLSLVIARIHWRRVSPDIEKILNVDGQRR